MVEFKGAGRRMVEAARLIMPAKDSRDPRPSEYGGYPGLVQPPAHVPTADEVLSMIKRTDTDGTQSGVQIQDRVKQAN